MTRHRSLFIKRSAAYCLHGSSKYIGLVFDLIVGFSYKPSLNSFFVYDFVLAIDCNQLLLIEWFSYDLETKTRQQNRNNKRTVLVQANARVNLKTSRPRTFSKSIDTSVWRHTSTRLANRTMPSPYYGFLWRQNEEAMFWSFHPLADKTNNEHLPKPFFLFDRRTSTLSPTYRVSV